MTVKGAGWRPPASTQAAGWKTWKTLWVSRVKTRVVMRSRFRYSHSMARVVSSTAPGTNRLAPGVQKATWQSTARTAVRNRSPRAWAMPRAAASSATRAASSRKTCPTVSRR